MADCDLARNGYICFVQIVTGKDSRVRLRERSVKTVWNPNRNPSPNPNTEPNTKP